MKEANASPARPTRQPSFPEGLVQKGCVTVRGIRCGFLLWGGGVSPFSLSAILLPKGTDVGEVRVSIWEICPLTVVQYCSIVVKANIRDLSQKSTGRHHSNTFGHHAYIPRSEQMGNLCAWCQMSR